MKVTIIKEIDDTYSVITDIYFGSNLSNHVVFNGNFCFAHTIRFAFMIAGYVDVTEETVAPSWFKGMN